MKIALLNIDKFVQANALQEVTNPVILDRGLVPTVDGLLSTEIFGTSTRERKQTFAYVKLNCHCLQPIVYKTFRRLDRRIDDIISGTKYFSIDKDGQIVEDENGETGIDWLYDNWKKIKFSRNESSIRGERIDLFELHTREELFQDKEIICPAFYRDINLQTSDKGKPSIHEINRPYGKLIRYAGMLNQGAFTFNLNYTKYQIQLTLVEIYNYFKEKIEKKRGIVRQSILGKSVDYGLRVIISSPKFTYNSPEDMPVDFYHTGIPLSFCCSLFTPFFAGWIQQFFARELDAVAMKYPIYDAKKKELVYVPIKDPLVQFNDEKIKEMMSTFIYSYAERFKPIELETESEEYPKVKMVFKGKSMNDQDFDINNPDNVVQSRYMTLTDLFYIAACDILADKHVYITRYPMADHLGIFPNRIHVLSTHETEEVWLEDIHYKHYPKVDINMPPEKVSVNFVEVVNLSNTYLQAIGGRVVASCA